MAKSAKAAKEKKVKGERVFKNVDAQGIGTTTKKVKISDTLTVPKDFRAPSTAIAFADLVQRARDQKNDKGETQVLNSLYLAAMRGIEAGVAAQVRNSFGTEVKIGGKNFDLMEVPVSVAVRAINGHMGSIALLGTGLTPEETAKMEKKERAWYNASRMLVESGACVKNGDDLAVAPAKSA
jgi:hypothetical protein